MKQQLEATAAGSCRFTDNRTRTRIQLADAQIAIKQLSLSRSVVFNLGSALAAHAQCLVEFFCFCLKSRVEDGIGVEEF